MAASMTRCGSVVTLAAVLAGMAGTASAQCQNFWQTPGPNGPVLAGCRWDPDGAGPLTERVVVGGSFARVENLATSMVAAWDPAGGAWTPMGMGITGDAVRAVAAATDGGLYVGGSFGAAGGVGARNIARWDEATKTWSALGAGLDGAVLSLHVMPDGDVIAAGEFNNAGGQPAAAVARWDVQTQTWSAVVESVDNVIQAVTGMADGDIVIGGWMTEVDGTPVSSVARWDAQTDTWSSLGGGVADAYWTVYDLLTLPDGDVVAAGDFGTAGGVAAPGLARWDADTNTWSAVGGGITGGIAAVYSVGVATDGDFIVGGEFTRAGGVTVQNCARLDAATGTWSAVAGVETSAGVRAVVPMANGGVVLGGYFSGRILDRVPGWSRVAVLPAGGSTVGSTRWVVANGRMTDAKVSPVGDQFYCGSSNFSPVRELSTAMIAVRDAATWGIRPFSTRATVSDTEQMAIAGNGLVIRWEPGQSALKLMGPDNDTVLETYAWAGSGSPSSLRRLRNGNVLAMGPGLSSVGGVAVNGMARWDQHTRTWSAFAPNGNPASGSFMREVCEARDGRLWAGAWGNYVTTVHRWDPAMGNWESLAMGTEMLIETIQEAPDGDILIGGYYTSAQGSFGRYARWDRQTGVFQHYPDLPGGSRMKGFYATPDGVVRTASNATINGASPGTYVARYDLITNSWIPEFTAFSSLTESQVLPNGDLVLVNSGDRFVYRDVPWVAEQSGATEAIVGGTLTLRATPAKGYTGVTVRWQRNGVDIADGEQGASSGGGVVSGATGAMPIPTDGSAAELTISGVQAGDEGLYRAIFTCACGSVESVAVEVTVAEDPCPCPADMDCSGGVDSDDVILYFVAWDQGEIAADFNGDGGVDSDDVIGFFERWDAGC